MFKNPTICFQIDTNIFSLNIFLFNVFLVAQVIYDYMSFTLPSQEITIAKMLLNFIFCIYVYPVSEFLIFIAKYDFKIILLYFF